MTAQARYMVCKENCPCLTSGRTAKDSVHMWLKHRFTAARMTWALRDSEGYLKDSATHCTIERSYFQYNREHKASIYAGVPDLEETVTRVQ